MSLSKFLPLRIDPKMQKGALTNQHKPARARTRNRHECRASLLFAERFNRLDVSLFMKACGLPEELSETKPSKNFSRRTVHISQFMFVSGAQGKESSMVTRPDAQFTALRVEGYERYGARKQ